MGGSTAVKIENLYFRRRFGRAVGTPNGHAEKREKSDISLRLAALTSGKVDY